MDQVFDQDQGGPAPASDAVVFVLGPNPAAAADQLAFTRWVDGLAIDPADKVETIRLAWRWAREYGIAERHAWTSDPGGWE